MIRNRFKRAMFPDVGLVKSISPESGPWAPGVTAATVRVPTLMSESIPQFSVEILDRHDRKLVTAIEVLSPTNKRGEGREEYLAKRDSILHSSAHLLEIDLLHEGRRLPMQRPLPLAPYYVYLCRWPTRPFTDVWAISLNQPLPVVPVPLLAERPGRDARSPGSID